MAPTPKDRKPPQTAEEWKAAIENAKWEKGDLARGFMENLLGERRDTSKDEPIPLPDFLKRPIIGTGLGSFLSYGHSESTCS